MPGTTQCCHCGDGVTTTIGFAKLEDDTYLCSPCWELYTRQDCTDDAGHYWDEELIPDTVRPHEVAEVLLTCEACGAVRMFKAFRVER